MADIARVREEEELETQIEEDHEDREDVASVSSSGGEAEGVDWGGDSDHDQDAECPEGGSEGTPGLDNVGSDVDSDVVMWTTKEVGDLTPGTPYFMEPRPKARVKDKSLPPSGRRKHGSVAEGIGSRVAVPAWSPSGEGESPQRPDASPVLDHGLPSCWAPMRVHLPPEFLEVLEDSINSVWDLDMPGKQIAEEAQKLWQPEFKANTVHRHCRCCQQH
jgi:hypothetical protein